MMSQSYRRKTHSLERECVAAFYKQTPFVRLSRFCGGLKKPAPREMEKYGESHLLLAAQVDVETLSIA